MRAALVLALLVYSCVNATSVTVPVEHWFTILQGDNSIPVPHGDHAVAAMNWGVEDALENTEGAPSDLEIDLEFHDNKFSAAVGLGLLIDFQERGFNFVAGNPLSAVLSVTGQAASVYNVAQLTGTATTDVLTDKSKYPLVSRSIAPSPFEARAAVAYLVDFFERYGRGWDQVALLSSIESYGVSSAKVFLDAAADTPLQIATYQQYLTGSGDASVEMREIKRSGARVIVTYMIGDYDVIMREAEAIGLDDELHVFFVGSSLAAEPLVYRYPNGTLKSEQVEDLRGTLGAQTFTSLDGPQYQRFVEKWQAADPDVLLASGPGTFPPLFPTFGYDLGIAIGLAVYELDKQGLFDNGAQPSAEKWSDTIRALDFDGATGRIKFDDKGDRPMPISLKNFVPELDGVPGWVSVGLWSEDDGVSLFEDSTPITWRDNTTDVPDLDIREGFDYWSCADGKMRSDPTGKRVKRHQPDGDSFDDIDSQYYCDNFIDCHNFSDESGGCASNYTVVFIVFGIITGTLILMTCCLIPFVIIFGFILPRKRVRALSPPFLLIVAVSGIVGFASTYAWYGKPHPVACGFQPWLLGLSVVSIISAMSAKTWRVWRIFRVQFNREIYSNLHLLALYILMMIPAVLILIIWTIVSTPTAEMVERDGVDHYVCTTGGFTGRPGGLVFFFIYVAYSALILLVGAFLSIVTRNIPSLFNESKLVAISIYNLGFLAAVVIPVVLVLQEINPFAAWIIRTVAILYAFGATLVLQFTGMVVGVVVIDRFRDKQMDTQQILNSETKSQTA